MKLKSFFEFAVQKWWIIYGIAIALFFLWLNVLVTGQPAPKPTDEIIFYTWITLRGKIISLDGLSAILGLIGIVLFGLKKKSFTFAVILAVITLWCSALIVEQVIPHIALTRDLAPDPTLTHVDSIRTGGHLYNLARHNATYEGIGHNYILYECDSLGIMCQAIYRYKQKTLNDAYADVNNPPFLASENANIAVHIGGKVVYTLPISTNS